MGRGQSTASSSLHRITVGFCNNFEQSKNLQKSTISNFNAINLCAEFESNQFIKSISQGWAINATYSAGPQTAKLERGPKFQKVSFKFQKRNFFESFVQTSRKFRNR